jgi:ankyrin repeat protein
VFKHVFIDANGCILYRSHFFFQKKRDGLFFHKCWDSGELRKLTKALKRQPFVDVQVGHGQQSLLHRILSSGKHHEFTQMRFVNLLLDAKASVNSQDLHLSTPLHVAVLCNLLNCAKTLLRRGANVNASTTLWFTPICYFSHGGSEEMVRLLLQYGADLRVKTCEQMTPFEYACFRPDTKISEIIYDACPVSYTNDDNIYSYEAVERIRFIQQKRRKFNASALVLVGVLRKRFRVLGSTGRGGCLPLDMVRLVGQHMRWTRFEEEWE